VTTSQNNNTKKMESHSTSASFNPVMRQLEHPERNLTLFFIASSGIFALIGTTLGTFMLAALSGVPTNFGLSLFSAHPYLQIYGFIAEFVVGVSYSLLPRFKVSRIPSLGLGYTTYVLLTCANIVFLIIPSIPSYHFALSSAAASLLLIGSIAFAVEVISLALRSAGGFPETNSLIMLSSISLVLITFVLFLIEQGLLVTDEFSPQMIFLALLGFCGSMIYSVETRSVSFRQSDYRKRFAKLTSIFQCFAVGVTFVSIILPIFPLLVLGGLSFLAASLSLLLSIRIFEFSHPLMYRPAMTKMHFSILRYNEVGIISGSVSLLFGIILGIALIATNSTAMFFLRDSFIHLIAIGFIGSAITVFAPMLLPGLLGKRAPVSGLSYGPIALLNGGIIVRVLGDFVTLVSHNNSALPIWESISGPLILGAMIWLLVVLHNVGRHPASFRLAAQAKPIESSESKIENARDATLIVIGRKTAKARTVSVWFVKSDSIIYLLPIHGCRTTWYLNTLSNPQVRLKVDKHFFLGKASDISERRQVEKVIGLFKDKYGERVYRNFYGDQVDRAIMISIS
jgi:hypothetical protein